MENERHIDAFNVTTDTDTSNPMLFDTLSHNLASIFLTLICAAVDAEEDCFFTSLAHLLVLIYRADGLSSITDRIRQNG